MHCPCGVDLTGDLSQPKIGMVDLSKFAIYVYNPPTSRNTIDYSSASANLLCAADTGIVTNYYGYLSCFGKVDFSRGTHNWPCKGKKWTPWGSGSDVVDGSAAAAPPIAVAARPKSTLFPKFPFAAPNATAGSKASVVTVTVTVTT